MLTLTVLSAALPVAAQSATIWRPLQQLDWQWQLTGTVDLSVDDDSLIYCEGYALFKRGMLPTLHAWVTDGQGKAIDKHIADTGRGIRWRPFQMELRHDDGVEEP